MTRQDEIKELFLQDMDCSQILFAHFAPGLGMEEGTANKVTACFGGGMMCGHTCGAVIAALMVLGLKFGHSGPGQQEEKVKAIIQSTKFREQFLEKYNSLECKELMGIDIAKPGGLEAVLDSGRMMSFCPNVIADAEMIVEHLMTEVE